MTLIHANASQLLRTRLTQWVFVLWTAHFCFYPLSPLAELPRQLYSPCGVLYWLPESFHALLFDETVLSTLRWTGLAACAACIVPKFFRYMSPLACVLITLEQSHIRGFSYFIPHSEVNLIWAAYILTVFTSLNGNEGRQPDLSEERFNPHSTPLFLIALMICTTYFLVGVSRLTFGGAAVHFDDTITGATLMYSRSPWLIDFNWGQTLLETPGYIPLLKIGFFVTTIFEVCAPLCLVNRHFRIGLLAVLSAFHVLVAVSMSIFFWENLMLLVFLIDWNRAKGTS